MRIFPPRPLGARLWKGCVVVNNKAMSTKKRNAPPTGARRVAGKPHAGSPAHVAKAVADGSGGKPGETAASAAEPVVRYLGSVIGWARLRSFDMIHQRAGVDVDRSGIIILTTLHRLGPMRMSDLAADIGLDRSTISRQVAAVVRAGYVQKMDDAADARASLLTLTARGQAARKKLADAWHDIVIELVSDWSHDEQSQLGRLLGKLVYQMQADSD
jgi:DNA-binding MarR family transcriptional regulator